MNVQSPAPPLSAKDFATDQEVRWCPGCGDYAILKCMQRTLPQIGARPETTVFVSGIGCSSRFPYYMATYGFHTIHGRAPAIATGVKLANPNLDVWVITGDGDGLSIGGNHLMHALRRNVDLNILLFNNEIYGLTKGQYSPTSQPGLRTPSTPFGSVDKPLNPCRFALGSGARFIARTIDTDQKHMPHIFERAHAHKGASFVEIFQNCIVYNDGVFATFTEKPVAADRQVHAVHGQPLIFGKEGDKGLRLNPSSLTIEVVRMGENGIGEDDLLVHDQTNAALAYLLTGLQPPDFPMVLGVIYENPDSTYERDVWRQYEQVRDEYGPADFNAFIAKGRTWRVE